MKKLFVLFFLTTCSLFSEEGPSDLVKKMKGYLAIKDHTMAYVNAQRAEALFPGAPAVLQAALEVYSECGEERLALETWKQLTERSPEKLSDRDTLELVAWSVIHRAKEVRHLPVRSTALIGAALARDIKAVPIILAEMKGPSGHLRDLSIKLATMYGDEPLKREVLRMMTQDPVWYVRLEAISAAGQMQMQEAIPILKEIIASPSTLPEERERALISIVMIYDKLDAREMDRLLKSNRSGLRQLGCHMISHFGASQYISHLGELLDDFSIDVQTTAIYSLVQLGTIPPQILHKIEGLLGNPNQKLAIAAAWASLTMESRLGSKALLDWLDHPDSAIRRFAAAAIASSGKAGVEIALKGIKKSKDPYVRANLAIGLARQRKQTKVAIKELMDFLYIEEKIMWAPDASLPFRVLAPSLYFHTPQIPRYPEIIDQVTRLEILSLATLLGEPLAESAIVDLLKKRSWEMSNAISYMAASTLLQEGDIASLALVRDLCKDPDPNLRMQAALVLTTIGGDLSVLSVLEEVYPLVSRENKLQILEAIAHLSSSEALPFLIARLEEPHQILRVAAASAIIQTIHH